MMNKMIHQKPSPNAVTGLILSGGYSNRFQVKNEPWQDKALVNDNTGKPFLLKTINTLKEICDEIIIMVNDSSRFHLYTKMIDTLSDEVKRKIKIRKDNHRYFCSGPTLGIASALDHISNNKVIVTPVDMPLLNAKLLEELLGFLEENSIVVPYFSSGKIEPLVFAFNKHDLLIHSQLLIHTKRSRADDFHRAVSKIKFAVISKKNEKITSSLFTSINDRKALAAVNSNNSNLTNGYFDSSKSFTLESKQNETELVKLIEHVRQNLFLAPSSKNLKTIMRLFDELSKSCMYFHSGILLYGIIESFPSTALINDSVMKKLHSQLVNNCIDVFVKEAKYWNTKGINFLELHSFSDAYLISKYVNHTTQKEFSNKISALKQSMKLEKKVYTKHNFDLLIDQRAPRFLEKAKKLIQKTEEEFNESSPQFTSNFLWDHSQRVGKIAYKLAIQEGIDPLIPTIAAIMHDAGKFVFGKYHQDEIAEEEHSATEAEKILLRENFSREEIEAVKSTITALYNDKLECNINCKIVHDADRLDKLGPLGIASFFRKLTLRGVNLISAIIRSLSRELTYTLTAPKSMMTKSGRELAETRSKKGMQYFEDLLNELKFYDISSFNFKLFEIGSNEKVALVIPEKCQNCDGNYIITLKKESGLKCEKAKAIYNCNNCNHEYIIDFCLPLIVEKS